MSPAQKAIQWLFDLDEEGRMFHLDDDPAGLSGVFTPDEISAVRVKVSQCFQHLQDPFFFVCAAAKDLHDRAELVFFEDKGCAIHNPTMSECGRFEVCPSYYGFTLYHTGGSNTAWHKVLSDGRYMLLTDSEGGCGSTHIFKQGEPILLGLYEGEGEPIAYSELTAGSL